MHSPNAKFFISLLVASSLFLLFLLLRKSCLIIKLVDQPGSVVV